MLHPTNAQIHLKNSYLVISTQPSQWPHFSVKFMSTEN